jgi:hypothetical protein
MTAQIDGDSVFDRHPAGEQRVEKLIPTSPLIADAMDENIGVFIGITPFPIMHAQTVVQEMTASWFRACGCFGRVPRLISRSFRLGPW